MRITDWKTTAPFIHLDVVEPQKYKSPKKMLLAYIENWDYFRCLLLFLRFGLVT